MAETGVFDGSAAHTFVGNEAHVRNDEEALGLDGDWKFVRSTFHQLGFTPFLPVSNPSQNLNRYLKSESRRTLGTGEWEQTTEVIDRFGAVADEITYQYFPSPEAFQLAVDSQPGTVTESIHTIISETQTQDVLRDVDSPHTVRQTSTQTLSELNTQESCALDCIANLAKVSLDDIDWGEFAAVTNPYGFFGPTGDPLGGTGGEMQFDGISYSRNGIAVQAQPQYFFDTTGDTWYYTAIKVTLTAQAPICIVTTKQMFLGEASGWSEGEDVFCFPFSTDENAEGVLEVITIPPSVESGKDRYFTYPYVKINGGAPTCCGQ